MNLIQELLTLNEANTKPVTVELHVDEVADELDRCLKKASQEGKKYEVKNSSIPAGPDSSKFRASQSGKIELASNLTVHGPYGTSSKFKTFLKIGGALTSESSRAIKKVFFDEFVKFLDEHVDDVGTIHDNQLEVKCENGSIYIFATHGTNWGGIGYTVHKK